jgi:hypothetical protein
LSSTEHQPHFSLYQRTPGKKEGGVMYRELPAKPNLEHLKNQAKELLHAFQQCEAAAKERCAVRVLGLFAETSRCAAPGGV